MQFKTISYFGVILEVSKDGRVIWNGEERNIYYNADGYSCVSIKLNKGWRQVRVARLVALAYIPNPNNLPEVNHKDYDRKNSNVENLEWTSRLDNIRYSKCNIDRRGIKNGRCRSISMYKGSELVKKFDYITECCEYLQKHYSPDALIDSIKSAINYSIKRKTLYKGFSFIKGDLIHKR